MTYIALDKDVKFIYATGSLDEMCEWAIAQVKHTDLDYYKAVEDEWRWAMGESTKVKFLNKLFQFLDLDLSTDENDLELGYVKDKQ